MGSVGFQGVLVVPVRGERGAANLRHLTEVRTAEAQPPATGLTAAPKGGQG